MNLITKFVETKSYSHGVSHLTPLSRISHPYTQEEEAANYKVVSKLTNFQIFCLHYNCIKS